MRANIRVIFQVIQGLVRIQVDWLRSITQLS